MRKENINFHQTFYPNFDYIGKILDVSDGMINRTIQEISMVTGIPTGESSGKVLPHIKYCEYMNLIVAETTNGMIRLSKTKLGELIYSEDPYFSENISRLLCHMFLTSPQLGSDLWTFICRSLQYKYGTKISKSVIEHDILENFMKSTKLTAFNSCYTNAQSLGDLNLIDDEGDNYVFKDFVYEEECFYAFMYSMYEELKIHDNNRSEYSVEEIFEELKWNYSLNWSKDKTMKFLEKANETGWIDINRQLTPITIILKRNIDDIINLIYSELV